MTKLCHGRQWHCRTMRTIQLDYGSPPQAMQWPDGRSKHIRQWLGCGNSIPRYVFPISKTWWALIGVPKPLAIRRRVAASRAARMTKSSQVVARDDEVIEQSGDFRSWAGTFRTLRD